MQVNTFKEIKTFVKEHLREVQSEWDYQGKDENGDTIYEHLTDYPTIAYKATRKIGGCNTSIISKAGQKFYQSRNNILGTGEKISDISNFRQTFEKIDTQKLFDIVQEKYSTTPEDEVVIYGEWCGGGIKDKHSISKTETKQWIIFAIKINGVYVPNFVELCDEENRVYNVLKWGMFEIVIDYSQFEPGCWKGENTDLPQWLQKFVDDLTLVCPVSKFFGVDGIGEGLVLESEILSKRTGEPFVLKIKNSEYDKPAVKTVVEKTSNPNLDKFLETGVVEWRLRQKVDEMSNSGVELSMKVVKQFQDLVLLDVLKECSQLAIDLEVVQKEFEPAVRKSCVDYFKTVLTK